jgi:putative transposase
MKRKRYSAEFKAKVSLEAIRENRTTAELASLYEVHTTMINKWKQLVLDSLPSLFSNKGERKQKETNELIDSLYKQVGQLTVELDWLKKKSALLT